MLTVSVTAPWASRAFQAAVLGLGAVWCAFGALRPFSFRLHWLAAPLAAAAAWPLLQLAAGSTVYRFATWTSALGWLTNLVLFTLALHAFRVQRTRQVFLSRLLWFAAILAAVSLVGLFTSEGRIFWIFPTGYDDLALGPFVYRNNYAAFVELVLPLALTSAVEDRRSGSWWIAAAAIMTASVAAAGSRAGTALAAAEIAGVLALYRRRAERRRVLRTGLAALVIALGVLAVAGWGYLPERLREKDPFSIRRELVQSSLAMLRDRPWAGSGLGTWPAAYPGYALFDNGRIANHAHSDWAEWAAEGGIPFVLLLSPVAIAALLYGVRRPWALGAAAVLIHALVDYPMQKPVLAGLVFTLLGAAAAHGTESPETQRPAPFA